MASSPSIRSNPAVHTFLPLAFLYGGGKPALAALYFARDGVHIAAGVPTTSRADAHEISLIGTRLEMRSRRSLGIVQINHLTGGPTGKQGSASERNPKYARWHLASRPRGSEHRRKNSRRQPSSRPSGAIYRSTSSGTSFEMSNAMLSVSSRWCEGNVHQISAKCHG